MGLYVKLEKQYPKSLPCQPCATLSLLVMYPSKKFDKCSKLASKDIETGTGLDAIRSALAFNSSIGSLISS